jgi:oxygen-dependent protoporphyrinogen oxidase
MNGQDVIVVGGGISGLAFAWSAAAAGRKVLLLEREARLGGCIRTERTDGGFWFELGAHTIYNSYGGLLEMIEGAGLKDLIVPRAKVPFRLLRDGRLLSVFAALDKWEALRSLPRAFGAKKQGQTVYAYFSRLVGSRNYDRVLGPFLAAVPSQSADAFPATGPGSLFKKRPRRKDVARHFTIQGGLSSVVDAVAARPGIGAATGVDVRGVEREGSGFAVVTADGRRLGAPQVALAVPPSVAASLVRGIHPELSAQLARVKMSKVETLGVAVPKDKAALPPSAFVVPSDDVFYSVVTRDVVPDARFRGFAFHFKPGLDREAKLRRVTDVLRVARTDLAAIAENETILPSPVLGHDALVRDVDRLLQGSRLALTGNYFAGLAIEDCVARSKQEFARLSALG